MAPISVKIVMDNGAVTRTIKFDSSQKVSELLPVVEEKMLNGASGKDYGLFLTSADDEKSGIWLEGHRNMDYYMLRDGDSLHYISRTRTMRFRMLDGSIKTMQVDESKPVKDLMLFICSKIGITNHDEYGLCREEQTAETEEQKPATGTLTLKRKAQKEEKDAILEQLSKKLKTDDNVEWLDQHKTLREMAVETKETLLLKRRLFYSDRKVDSRDPVQLNLLYVQTRDAILEGRHPVTVDQAVEFAGIQCQIHYGDFQEDKHKPGFIENLREFLPEEYASSWGVEKKILKLYRKYSGMSQLEAKYLYTRTARELPTYGVTFFLVKEQQKNKKKLVPRLLGINSSSILRLDEVTKDILQVWPLTQVKTFHAGKTNSFTLNFGDYSDKEYSVKTNDAHRIRDILQSYIDIIRKRMMGPYNPSTTEGGIIYQDSVESSRANVMEFISNNPSKIIQESFVGPSKIITVDPGTQVAQGTQFTTVQQIIISDKLKSQQRGLAGEVPMRSDYVRKLNRMNSNSVKIVTLLSDPHGSDGKEVTVQEIVHAMEQNIPDIDAGVKEAASKQQDEESRKKLLDELQELCDYMCTMANSVNPDAFNSAEAEDTAKKIANLTTQMYCSLDPKTKRRSELFTTHSRQSFVEDEKTRESLNQATYIAATAATLHAIESADGTLVKEYTGPVLEDPDASLEKSVADELDKLNAAVAMYLASHEDPKNVGYPALTHSMQTIQHELPKLAQDVKALGSTNDKHGQQLLDKARDLCDALRKLCAYTGGVDREKIHDGVKNYGDSSRNLLSYIFTPNRCRNPDKEHEIVELAKQVAERMTDLLTKANELEVLSKEDPGAADVDKAGAACADAAGSLMTCAQITAQSIHEPHCQSALTAASENVASSAQQLATAWKPLIKDSSRQPFADELRSRSIDLAQALDRLKEAYSNLNGKNGTENTDDKVKERQRLQFIMTKKLAHNNLQDAEKLLDQPVAAPESVPEAEALQRSLAQRMAQLNAAIASLIAATSDPENADYDTAEMAVSAISKSMPAIIKDTKALSATKDEKARQAMLDDIKALCEATRGIYASAGQSEDEGQLQKNNAVNFANASGKLLYTFNPRANQQKEHEIIDLSKAACEATSQLLAQAHRLASVAGGEGGARVDARGARVADAAQALLTAAQITAASANEPRCQAALLSSLDGLSASTKQLADAWTPLVQEPEHKSFGLELDKGRQEVEKAIEKLRKACEVVRGNKAVPQETEEQKRRRLKFITTKSAANNAVDAAEKELNKPVVGARQSGPTTVEQQRALAEKMAQLNAAIASLIAATSNRDNPDYDAAESAVATITKLMPVVVKDTKTLSANKDEKARQAMLNDIKSLCEATRGICVSEGQLGDEKYNEAAAKFANASGRLFYICSPNVNQQKEHQIIDLSKSTCEAASQVLARAYQLAETVGGEGGARVDARGARVADAAQALLITAQITAASANEPHCQAALLSSADGLSASINQLSDAWTPLVQEPEHKSFGVELDKGRQEVEKAIEKLKKACEVVRGNEAVLQETEEQKRRRLKFITTKSAANNAVDAAEKELNKPIVGARQSGPATAEQQRALAEKMAQLNAAIASLIAATSNRVNPDYDAAESAVATITKLMPVVVKDTKTLSANKDEKARQAMLEDIKSLCEATRGICVSEGQLGDEKYNEAAAKFANASGRLFYICSPNVNQQKEHQIIDLSKSTCEAASQVLARAYQLAETVGGEGGARVDARGARVADAAQALLTTAQITAPSVHESPCKTALLSTADGLSISAQQLSDAWTPLVQVPEHRPLGADLDKSYKDLEREIGKLKKACEAAACSEVVPQETDEQKRRRLKFITTKSAAKNAMNAAEYELNKPVVGARPSGPAVAELQRALGEKMAQLNAAIASLITTTSDRDKPDYEAAESAVATITQLMPVVVKDTKTLSASKDDKARQAMMEDIKALCEATRGICTSEGQLGDEKYNEAAAKFANASGRLLYICSPNVNQQKEHQIIDLSKSTCEAASEVLARAYQLAESVGGEGGLQIDARGARVADAAQALLTAAQITAPSVNNTRCQASLLSAADGLSGQTQQLADVWKPLAQAPEHRLLGEELDKSHKHLEKEIERLRNACAVAGGEAVPQENEEQKRRRLKFVTTKSAAKNAVDDAEKELYKPIVGARPSGPATAEQQRALAEKMAQLNAAIASLIAATSDRQTPDYETAESAVTTITQLMPVIVKDTKSLSATKDEKARQAMLDDIKALCEATRGICASEDQLGDEKYNDAAAKFADVSGRLFYICSPNVNQQKEYQIIDLSKSTCEAASEVLARAYQLAESAGGDGGARVDARGARVADAAQALLTTAQITAPSIHEARCQTAMLSAADGLLVSAQQLSDAWTLLVQVPEHRPLGADLDKSYKYLEREIEKLKKACVVSGSSDAVPQETEEQKKRRLKFITTKSAASNAVDAAEKELNKPIVGARTSGPDTEQLQRTLAEKLAQLNAAIASLIASTSDRDNPDYDAAESAVATITKLMPVVVKDTKSLSATKDEKARQAMLEDIRVLCEATRGICASEDQLGDKKYNEAAGKFANASGRLFYTCSPDVNQQKEHQIIDLSKAACEAASQLLVHTYRLASAAGGEGGARVDARGARVADAAQALLTTAQITAPSAHKSDCQTALLFAVDGLSTSAQQLNEAWAPLTQAPEYKQLGIELENDQKQLYSTIQKLKAVFNDSGVKTKPAIPVRTHSLKGRRNALSEQQANGLASKVEGSRDFTQQFLHQLRNEASTDIVSSCEDAKKREVERKLREEQKKLEQQFVQSVDSAVTKIHKAEESVKKASKSKKGKVPINDPAELLAVHKQMENNLALTSVAVSSLVACNRPDQIDYTLASMSITVLSESVPVIAEDAILLSGSLDEKSRKDSLDSVIALCNVSKTLCNAAKNNRQKLNETAIEFGNSAAKLLYAISTDVDPGQEKEVIARAKLIGDNAARVSLCGASAAKALGDVDHKLSQVVCNAGGRCADAAGTLVYTAKLVAPSIHHVECQESLTKASEDLSLRLNEFSKIWEPLSSEPKYSNCFGELHIETVNLEKLLADLKQDLKAGKLVKKREPQLVIENTPLRQLSAAILEDAKKRAESTSLPEGERREFANYSNQIADAIRIMDVANAKCQQSPHETKKREELEEAVQNLQHILLQLRPRHGDAQQSNIVDLTDFVKEVSSTAEQMIESSNTRKTASGKQLAGLEDVKGECHKITLNAFRLLSPVQRNTDGTTEDDILQFDHFGQDCKGRVDTIMASIKRVEDEKARNILEDKATSLAESCHLLRFATKSALATAQSAALDETINDLNDLEMKIDKMLLSGKNTTATKYNPHSASLMWSRAQLSASAARAGGGETQNLAPALNKYVAELRTTDAAGPTHKKMLAEHLNKLLHLLKTLTVSTSRRVATWQPVDEEQVSTVTQQMSQEFANVDHVFDKTATKSGIPVLKSVDFNKLLVPNNSMQVKGDKKHLEEQVQHLATKLNSMTGTIMLSVHKPESLARSANATVDAATQLAATARALKDTNDPVQSKRIEDATQDMSFVTYNLLKTSEMVTQDQNQPAPRRRLFDACRALNDAINKLARTSCTSSSNKLQSECGELTRTLQMQQGVLQGTHPSCALSYADSLDALQQQYDVIQKIKDNKPMSRDEFGNNLNYVTSATCNSTEYAAQCAYLLSISEQHKDVAKEGLVDVGRIQTITGSLQDVCFRIMRFTHIEDAKVEEGNLNKYTQELHQAITEASAKPIDETVKHKLQEAAQRVTTTANVLQVELNKSNSKEVEIFPATINIIDAVGEINAVLEHSSLVPKVGTGPTEAHRSSEVMQISRGLITHLQALIKEVKERKLPEEDDDDTMTWVMFNDRRKNVLDTFEALISKLRENGQLAGLILVPQSEEAEEDETQKKSYVQIQVDLANKWLQRPIPKSDVKATGQKAAREVIDIAEKMVEDLQGNEKEEIHHLITETDQLLGECSKKYDSERASLLMDKLKELRKAIERLVVTRVVEDFIEEETPLADFEILTDAERDETKRKFLLERKIAELLAQLGRVTKTARFVADTGSGSQNVTQELRTCSNQAELLAPMLVKAAQERVNTPNDQVAIDNYKSLLSKYAEAMSKVRELCDMSVNPLDFVQTAGDTMQRMRDESTEEKCPMKTVKVSSAIDKLVNRVFEVGMHNARSDPELQAALASARERLEEIRPKADTRASRMPDWKVTTAEILRTTGEVESVLGGEIIFKKQPEPDQPIYNAALDLHAAIREWSGRDNEIVAVAKRMAVLMAKLSEYMNTSKKREVIVTSKSIVQESHEVAHLAKKLALECTDIRIRTNLLQVCERIPTISGQLKMLTTVKGASLGHQDTEEDKEAMNMLVGNAQNLMLSVQEVVKAAASASVKINAQRSGPRMRWVRRNIYY